MTTSLAELPLLFQPCQLRQTVFPNRIMLSPMCQYSATDGMANEWHFAHLGKFATAGFGGIMLEASAVLPEGRITHGDLGIWSDAHSQALQNILRFCQSRGSAVGLQLAHAGRKASIQRPWHGNGPLDETDAARSEYPWEVMGASAVPAGEGWLMPAEMTLEDIKRVQEAFAAAAKRTVSLGVDFLELHGAHGYLIQSFLSPLSNHRSDAYGGSRENRMRMAVETARCVRQAIPETMPLFFRVSAVDGFEGGWEIEDSIALAGQLKAVGVDIIDCSSGGNAAKGATASAIQRQPGFQIPYAAAIRQKADIKTMAVGLILTGEQAEAALVAGDADMIAIGREALLDPYWPRHQAQAMGLDAGFDDWPEQYGWWLDKRAKGLPQLAKAER